MISRIRVLGILLCLGSITSIIYFTLAIPVDLYLVEMSPYFMDGPGFLFPGLAWDLFDWRWAIAIPVYLFILFCCGVFLWMGGKMVTTVPTTPTRIENENLNV